MDRFQAIRLLAYLAVHRSDPEYHVRRIHRWYSKTFHTPIAEVEAMPFDDLLQAMFEEKYEAMDEREFETERLELLVTDEDRYKQMLVEEAEAAESFEFAKIVGEEERAKKQAQVVKAQEAKMLAEAGPKAGPITQGPLPESKMPTTSAPLPPGISMKFVDESEFEDELEGYGSMTQPRKP